MATILSECSLSTMDKIQSFTNIMPIVYADLPLPKVQPVESAGHWPSSTPWPVSLATDIHHTA